MNPPLSGGPGRARAIPTHQPPGELPPYPEAHAASAIGQQVANRARTWGTTAQALREEIAAVEEALVTALEARDRQRANRDRLRAEMDRGTDRGLR